MACSLPSLHALLCSFLPCLFVFAAAVFAAQVFQWLAMMRSLGAVSPWLVAAMTGLLTHSASHKNTAQCCLSLK